MAKELILTSDVPGLGIEGDLVKVADGYARNFLLPRKLAAPVTSMSRRQLEAKQAAREARMRTELEQAQHLARRLEAESVTIPVKAGPEGKLYGAVHAAEIAAALAAQGFAVDRYQVLLKEPLRELGVVNVPVKLHPDLSAVVKVWIVEE